MTDMESTLLNALNRFCFDQIWNEPESELRANIVPQLVQDRSCSGSIYIGGTYIDLPTTNEPYFLYYIPDQLMFAFSARSVPDQWHSATQLCNDFDILIRTYHLSGKMMSFGKTYIRKYGTQYLLAVAKSSAIRLIPHTEMKNIRITMYFDSDAVNALTIGSFVVPTIDDNLIVRRQIHEFIQQCPHNIDHTTVYVNGYEIPYTGVDSIPVNSFVDVLHDENELLSFTVDLTDPKNSPTFLSERDKLQKLIVHTPKSLNPTNKVLTHNTAEIHVRTVNPDGTVGRGLYLHRCAEHSVDQLTHNDISIPTYILDAFRDYLGTQEIALKISFKQHDKDNVLIRDKNYIDLLYTCDDATIIQHLLGRVSQNLDFWKASHLESSEYVRMMFDVPNVITPENMWGYVEGLGYYHTMALLCKKIIHTDISAWFSGGIHIPKPLLFTDTPTYPVCYRNGQKIRDDHVRYLDNIHTNVELAFDEHVNFTPGDKLTVELFVDGPSTCFAIVPSEDSSAVILPYHDFVVIEEFDMTSSPVQGLDHVGTKVYKEVTKFVGDIVQYPTDTGMRLVFGPRMYGRKFIIQNRYCVYRDGKYLDQDIVAGNPLMVHLNVGIRDGGYTVPIWNAKHTKVYLNGKYLVEGVDYTIFRPKDALDRISAQQLILNNVEYLVSENNYLEWIVTSAQEENTVEGWVVNNVAASESELALLFPEMTMLHVDGLYESAPIDRGNKIELPAGKYREGAPFEVCTTVPDCIDAFLSKYHPNDDLERLTILNEYFYGKQPQYPDIVVMPHSHRCFSPYVVTIIRDILNGTLRGISLDPDVERMKTQFAAYQYLYDCDLVMQLKYNLDFVDVFPHYRQVVVPDPNTYRILQAFINSVMPEDSVTSGEVFYG